MILSWLLHAIYSTILAQLLSLAVGRLHWSTALLSLLLGFWLGRRHAKVLIAANPDFRFAGFASGVRGVIEIGLSGFVLYACLRHFVWMFFRMDAAWSTLAVTNFGDLPLHINFIRAFAQGLSFPPMNPIFMSEPLRYPYGADLYNALFEILGVHLSAHLAVIGICGAFAAVMMLRIYAGWWGIGAFFLNGGVLALSQQNTEWKNLLLSVFVTQRGMLLALPLGLLLLILTRRQFEGGREPNRSEGFWLGILWGFFPLIHLHSFVAVSVMMAAIAVEFSGLRGLIQLLRSKMALVAYLPATIFILHSTDFLRKASAVRVEWGWSYGGNFLQRLFLEFGAWLALPIATLVILVLTRQRRRLLFELAFHLLLISIFFNVMLAPWAWDNIKVLIWPYLGIVRVASVVIEGLLTESSGWMRRLNDYFVRPSLVFALLAAGFFTVVESIDSPARRAVQIYSYGEIASVEGALAQVPAKAVFASARTHNHPLTYFGALRALGYEGHLWSHGIDSRAAAALQEKIFTGDPEWLAAARKLGVTHIFWGPAERLAFGPARRPWMDVLPNLSRVKDYEIYAIK